MDWVFMKSPTGEVKEVEATASALTPLMATGWIQIPPPSVSGPVPAASAQEDIPHGKH